jgi:hypothetical protein
MRSNVIERRAASVRQDWSAAERVRRAEEATERLTELIELLGGSSSQTVTPAYSGGPRRRARVHAAT